MVKLLTILSVTTGITAVLMAFGGLWWWALVGMSGNVATATYFSVLLLAVISTFSWLAAIWYKMDNES